ncbi:putative bifunctional diguanylate cyclase/phosphodiesterase [Rhodoferax mekongensis]|uniref:putative bifunctional diguanylate cyclase/phosphodiesterase n=1 Tax=Rhodoferax mekongensis TaxID=3068341 RepID=UPI0028BF3C72|nr:EAL domain-containing protein [Rhodoferax sp. TBRC 17199]MDT7516429.1 EAL domain-containing protein [Rhodoferax sp. TBRC 17199]
MSNTRLDDMEEATIRSRRVFQFALLVFIAFSGTAAQYGLQSRWDVVLSLGLGAALMLPSQWLNHRGHHEAAAGMVLAVATLSLFSIMWFSDGLRDSSLLGYPVILIGAGQLLKPRHFWLLLAFMLGCVVLLGLGTLNGWRTGITPGTELDRLTDSVSILLINGFLVWFLTYDMQNALVRLRAQIARFHASEKNLTYLAQHDGLTRLPNRILGNELLTEAMRVAAEEKNLVAMLFVDLDNFKDVNDSLGHSAGDDFLVQVAQRLRESVRQTDIVCRQGGDEFLIGLTGLHHPEAVAKVSQDILQKMQAPFHLRGMEVLASCSIGIALYPQHGTTFDELLRHADLAMYHAKEAGRNTFRFFSEDIRSSVTESLHLISSLRQAVTHHEFVLYYQPVFDLHSGKLLGAEALVRWQNPKLGMVSPGLFITLAEKSGLIVDIGQWVLTEACRQMQAWRQQGATDLFVSVNLSPVQFSRGNVEAVIAQALQETGLDPQQLELEVTESTLIHDTEKFITTLGRIQHSGIRMSIDDFGTGYSNLSYLQRFPVHKLKIDQSFVRRLMQGQKDVAMVSAIIHLAKSLQLTVTAEGVENEATREALTRMGCDQAQGYLFARPMPAKDFEAYWLDRPALTPIAGQV